MLRPLVMTEPGHHWGKAPGSGSRTGAVLRVPAEHPDRQLSIGKASVASSIGGFPSGSWQPDFRSVSSTPGGNCSKRSKEKPHRGCPMCIVPRESEALSTHRHSIQRLRLATADGCQPRLGELANGRGVPTRVRRSGGTGGYSHGRCAGGDSPCRDLDWELPHWLATHG
jgi:hypothetical protein